MIVELVPEPLYPAYPFYPAYVELRTLSTLGTRRERERPPELKGRTRMSRVQVSNIYHTYRMFYTGYRLLYTILEHSER